MLVPVASMLAVAAIPAVIIVVGVLVVVVRPRWGNLGRPYGCRRRPKCSIRNSRCADDGADHAAHEHDAGDDVDADRDEIEFAKRLWAHLGRAVRHGSSKRFSYKPGTGKLILRGPMRPHVGEALRQEAAPWTVLVRADQGRVRQRMEDAFSVELDASWGTRRVHAVAVFDGLGGEPPGQEASRAAAANLRRALAEDLGGRKLLVGLNAAVAKTGGAPTAVVALLAAEPPRQRVDLFAVGDSAAYGTNDKTWGLLLPRDGAPGNVVTDYLGNAGLAGHAATLQMDRGDTLLLCTDGVDGVLDDARLRLLASTGPSGLEAAADQVVRDVWAGGAPDNATLAIVRRR